MKKKRIITLITDFGLSDTYVATMKGVILSINPDCTIIDITHAITPQDVWGGCFALNVSYSYFPNRTIHLAIVDPGVGSARRPMLMETEKFFFIGPDNGIFSPLLSKPGLKNVYTITNSSYFLPETGTTFHGRDIFAPVAAHLSKGTPPESFGALIHDYVLLTWPKPLLVEPGQAEGEIIHIDRFGNLITNFSGPFIAEIKSGSDFKAELKGRCITRFVSAYAFGEEGVPFCVQGSSGYLEVSVRNGSACDLLKAKRGDRIKIFTKMR